MKALRFIWCLVFMAYAPYDLWRGHWLMACFDLALVQVVLAWEKSVQIGASR